MPRSFTSLPFAHLNLRVNPFGEFDNAIRAKLAVADIESLVQRLREPGFSVQFIGDQGRGKTTHMLAILHHFPEARYVYVGEGERPQFVSSNPIFIDEIQRVPRWRRRRLFRRGVPLVIGTHEDVSDELAQAGFTVETVHVGEGMSPADLQLILNQRIKWARRSPGTIPQVRLETAYEMMDRFGSNVRAIEGHLYEVFQDLGEIRDV